jgi:hypothetical protein
MPVISVTRDVLQEHCCENIAMIFLRLAIGGTLELIHIANSSQSKL